MTITQVARIALQVFGNADVAAVMVAIAKGESNFNETAGGDSANRLIELRNQGVNIAQSSIDSATIWGCPPNTGAGYASWGLWQIFLGANHDLVTNLSGLTDPCEMANWLITPTNNALAAKAIYDSQGFNAWSVYNSGKYNDYLQDAILTVNTVLEESTVPQQTPQQTFIPSSIFSNPLLYFSLAIGYFAFFLYQTRKK